MNLHSLIRDNGLRQSWVADQLGMPVSSFHDVCRGRRSLPAEKLRSLAELMRLPVDLVAQAVENSRNETANGPQTES